MAKRGALADRAAAERGRDEPVRDGYILVFGRSSSPSTHGGTLRTQQILSLLSQLGPVRVLGDSVEPEAAFPQKLRVLWERTPPSRWPAIPLIVARYALRYRRWPQTRGFRSALSAAAWCCLAEADVARRGAPRLMVIEDVRWLARPGGRHRVYPIVAFPQNLESLVDGLRGKQGLRCLRVELELLGRCDAVFTISFEEAWLLNALGIPAQACPYVPPPERMATIQLIAEQRRDSDKTHDLLMGSATNLPTRRGVEEVLMACRHRTRDKPLLVIGLGTDRYRGQGGSESIRVLGRVSDAEAQRLIVGARALLTHQSTGTGALTRLVECALAGVPVLATRHAARSAPPAENIAVFESVPEMLDALPQVSARCRPPPSLPDEWRTCVERTRTRLASLTSAADTPARR